MDVKFHDVVEGVRTYVYPDGANVQITNPTKIGVRKSGYHMVEDKEGGKWIVPPGWRVIRLDNAEWSW